MKGNRMKKVRICSVEDCGTSVVAKGYCDKHYRRVLHHNSLEVKEREGKRYGCVVPYCEEPHKANGVCVYHYGVLQKWNTPFQPKTVKYCGWQDCNRIYFAKGLCAGHYHQWRSVLESEGLEGRDIYQ